jgi:two-component system sensor histidine kinase DegS
VISNHRDQPHQEYELLGTELHDGPCQYILSAQMLLEAFRHSPAGGADARHLERISELLDRATEELRRLAHGLQPLHLRGQTVEACIDQLIADNEACGGPQVEFYHDGDLQQLPRPLVVGVLRIAQEALNNARRHSKSTKVLIGLTRDEDCVSLQVQDWGVGFKPDRVRRDCYGLKGICHRVALLGGVATIDSRPGKGTCITVELSLASVSEPMRGKPQLPC